MVRYLTCTLLAFGFVVAFTADAEAAKKNQMVKGTIKSVSPEADVLVVNQKVGTGVVDRQLSITKEVEWTISTPEGTQTLSGRDGLKFLVGEEGAGDPGEMRQRRQRALSKGHAEEEEVTILGPRAWERPPVPSV